MAERAATAKRRRPEVARFMLDPTSALARLARELGRREYRPGASRGFVIYEPTRRVIAALPFRDRVVQHALVDAMLPSLERWFAPQSYACRKGKGTHRALVRATELLRSHDWVLRLDIRKFFPSADHEILRQLLLPRCPRELGWLLERVLRSDSAVERVVHYFPGDDLFAPLSRPHGLPIGNLTSQVWANALLTPVDHLLASHLGLGSFVRYSDDILVFSHSRERLVEAWAAVEQRCERLRLRLHPGKCRLVRTEEPTRFLGFVLARRGSGVRVRLWSVNVRRFRRRMADLRRMLAHGAIEPEDLLTSLRAWLAHARHGHTRELCRLELDRLGNLLAAGG